MSQFRQISTIEPLHGPHLYVSTMFLVGSTPLSSILHTLALPLSSPSELYPHTVRNGMYTSNFSSSNTPIPTLHPRTFPVNHLTLIGNGNVSLDVARMLFFAVKYHQRSVIVLEFINMYDSNEGCFLAAYPESEHGHTKLLAAINDARRERGETVSRKPRNVAPPLRNANPSSTICFYVPFPFPFPFPSPSPSSLLFPPSIALAPSTNILLFILHGRPFSASRVRDHYHTAPVYFVFSVVVILASGSPVPLRLPVRLPFVICVHIV
ncbi:hypothetical protein PAXRUDRAFT_12035 [Paxillus rubicundulus Ve08.2h10]|uniref:Uncharacterized protein n=1 Tax=Paxillus rubicundulus Ve08.2h10 TaxID=930991 RepID=A0A0D0E1Z9_9AGAM|nr:hypothetical protein PAXRUDRAFT_12035 [Paxillus rubicundulus Ve08.2h10]